MAISCLSSPKTFSSVHARLPSPSSFPCTSRSHDLSLPDSIDPSAVCVKSSASRFPARATSQKEALESRSTVVSDENVPEGHRGLHGFLYGDNGADVHASELRQFTIKQGEDDGSSILPVDDYVISRDGLKYAGVYAVYDSRTALQFIGYSRSIVLSLRSHLNRLGKEKCSFVRVKAYTDPAMVTRNRLEQEKEKWLNEAEMVPPGNSSEKDLWDSNTGGAVATLMSEAEKLEYEEKKLKLRKAMGENLHDDVEGEEDDAKTRRLKLLQAMEGDDWSSVISGQTNDALNQTSTVNKSEQSSSIVSPFEMKESKGSEGRKGLYSAGTYELTVENVDKVLNEVRPYLIADGGNVEVVSVDSGVISLRLQGACGTCPSSTVTMKMGIERVLKEKFGEAFKEVVQVDQQPIGASVMAVDAHLEMLRPAIHSYSGFVEVVSVANGECRVKYKGPPPIGMGIQAAIKDKFPDITTVVLLDA